MLSIIIFLKNTLELLRCYLSNVSLLWIDNITFHVLTFRKEIQTCLAALKIINRKKFRHKICTYLNDQACNAILLINVNIITNSVLQSFYKFLSYHRLSQFQYNTFHYMILKFSVTLIKKLAPFSIQILLRFQGYFTLHTFSFCYSFKCFNSWLFR